MSDRSILVQAHSLLQTAVYEVFAEDQENYLRDVYELIDTHLNAGQQITPRSAEEAEAMVEDDVDRRSAA